MNQSDGAASGADLTLSLLGAAQAVEARIEASLSPLDLSLAKLNVLAILVGSSTPLTLGELAQQRLANWLNNSHVCGRTSLSWLTGLNPTV